MGYGDRTIIRKLKRKIDAIIQTDNKASRYRVNPSVPHYEHRKMLRSYYEYKIRCIEKGDGSEY